jgi:membrane-associated phospholipid phosphatase
MRFGKSVRTRLGAATILVALIVPVGVSQTGISEAATTDPAAWRPWYLTSADQFRLPAPPTDGSNKTLHELRTLRTLQKERTKKIKRDIRFWNNGPVTTRWTQIMIDTFKQQDVRPPAAARALSLLNTGMFDALIAAYDSRNAYHRSAPSKLDNRIDPILDAKGSTYPAVNAVIAGAAENILSYIFVNVDPSRWTALAGEATQTRLYAGVNYKSDIDAGRDLGHQVAGAVITYAGSDGSKNTGFSHGPKPEGDQYWQPSPPGYEDPTGGPVGTWKPWLAPTGADLRTGSQIDPPYEYGSDQFMSELNEVMDVNANLTQNQKSIANFWDDGINTYTPAGHWNNIAIDLARSHHLSTNRAGRIFGYLGAAELDSAIAFFDAKYFWWSIRPVTSIRRLCDGGSRLCSSAELQNDPSLATYPGWSPYINTPPFPSYPGGHGTFSGAASQLLAYFFPDSSDSLIQQGEQAANSRLLGGIHFRHDNDAGLQLGRYITQLAIERAQSDGSGMNP